MNQRGRRVLSFLFLLTAALCSGCLRQSPRPVPLELFNDCFVNPSPEKLVRLRSGPADTAGLGAGLAALRKKSLSGCLHEVLIDKAGFPYHLGFLTPAAVRADTAYPLVLYLHGGTGTERIDKGDSAFFMLRALADSCPLFLASPSANRYAPWWSDAGLLRILQSLRYMALHYPIDPAKVFLAGVSDGATGCWAAANSIPAPFAGFIAVSGFGGMLPALGMRLFPGNMANRPLYNVNAGRDRIYPLDQVQLFVAEMQQQGVPVTLKTYPDELHGFDYKEKEMATLAGIIRAWKRPETAGVSWTFMPGFPNLPDNLISWDTDPGNAFIELSLQRDTATVRASGVRSCIWAPPGSLTRESIVCRFAEGRVRALKPVKKTWPCQVELLFNRCFPRPSGACFYRIKP